MLLVDTAGLRKRSRVSGSVEFYAQIRSERAAQRADVAIVVVDASEGLTSEDLRVADLAMKSGLRDDLRPQQVGRGGDGPRGRQGAHRARVRQRPPVITTSALSGRNVEKLLAAAIELADRRAQRIPTPKLNRFVAEVVARRQPPAKRGKRLRLYYAAQVGVSPPRIAIQVNDRRLITQDWAYHLENRMREHYALEGVPLIIDFVPKAIGRHGRARRGARPRLSARRASDRAASSSARSPRRLRGVRYFLGDLFYLLSRPFRGHRPRRSARCGIDLAAEPAPRLASSLGAIARGRDRRLRGRPEPAMRCAGR